MGLVTLPDNLNNHTNPALHQYGDIGENVSKILDKPKNDTHLLIPKIVYDLADNPENVKLRIVSQTGGNINFFVYERDSPKVLTDPNLYAQWLEEFQSAKKGSDGILWQDRKDSKGVNRFHQDYRQFIASGELSLRDRIFLKATIIMNQEYPLSMTMGVFDGETHSGIGQDFYKNALPAFCKERGVRFIIGSNNRKNITFFTDTVGRILLSEITEEGRKKIFPRKDGNVGDIPEYTTVQFLYPEDALHYRR